MRVNRKLANQVHDWLIAEGEGCRTQDDLDTAADRFLKKWPRVKSEVLQYVSEMFTAQLHPRTYRPSRIIDGVGKRMVQSPPLRRRWWQIGYG
jgi:hypothetical protein